MRKNKSKLMAFSLLALCLACLGFGVYALKNATLTVTGTVGFTAHDCMVNVLAYIEGDGVVTDENGIVTPDNHGAPSERRALNIAKNAETNADTNEMLVGGASESEWTKTAQVGAIFFTDLTETGEVAQIKMTFTLTNQSAFAVTASISNANIADVVTGVSEDVTLEVGGTGELTAIFNLELNEDTEAYPEINNLPFEVKLDFRKATTGGNQGGEDVGGEEEKLQAPANPTLSGDTVSFDVVDGATGYEISYFNGDAFVSSYTVTTTQSALEQKPTTAGTYTVKLRAVKTEGDKTVYSDYVEIGAIAIAEKTPSEGLAFSECALDGTTGTGAYMLTGMGECRDAEVVVPSTYEGLPVVAIKAKAFYQNYDLMSITLPDTVVSIGMQAFHYCTKLSEIAIPDGVTVINANTFNYCTSMTKVALPSNLESIGIGAFYMCNNLAEIQIPEGVKSIGQTAFSECKALANITMYSNIESIGEDAFNNISESAVILYHGTPEQYAAISNSDTDNMAGKVTIVS